MRLGERFCSEIVPGLLDALVNCFQRSPPANIVTWLLQIIENMIDRRLCLDEIFSTAFIENVFLRASYLSDEDLSTFSEIPLHFLSFCYRLETSRTTPRHHIHNIIHQLDPAIVDLILESVLTDSENPIEAEAKLYLLSCIAPFKQEEAVFYTTAMAAIKCPSPYLIATAVAVLMHLRLEKLECNQLSVDLLLTSGHVVVQVLAIYLFQNTFDVDIPISAPLDQIVMTLLQLANVIQDPKPGEMIQLLVRQYPDQFFAVAQELVSNIVETWLAVGFQDTACGGTDFLLCVINLVEALPQDSEAIQELAKPLADVCCQTIIEVPETRSERQLLEILALLIRQLTSPPAFLFELAGIFLPYFAENFEVASVLVDDFGRLFVSLIAKPGFFETQSVQALVAICDICLEHADAPRTGATALILYASLVQVGREQAPFVLDRALVLLSNPNIPCVLFGAAFVLLSSALMVSSAEVLPMIPPEIIPAGPEDNLRLLPLQYLNVCFAGLCIMAQNGSVEAFLCAANLAPVILQKQSGEEMAEVDDEDLIADRIEAEQDLDMFLCELPSDTINIHQLFADTLTATGWAARLSEDPHVFLSANFMAGDAVG
jgi:hypothetical protein